MRIHVRNVGIRKLHALDVDPTDTIRSLKGMIQRVLCFSDEEMAQRILVIDNRDPIAEANCPSFLKDGRDLFDDATSSATLDECGVEEGDTLRLGWKGPFLIELVLEVDDDDDCLIEVRCSDTIRELKVKVEEATGKPVKEDNFPQVLLSADADDRTLLSLGFYKDNPTIIVGQSDRSIFCNPNNKDFPYIHLPKVSFDHGFPPTKLQIVVEFPNMPWRTPLLCEPTDLIRTVRNGISGKYSGQTCGQKYIEEGRFVLFSGQNQLKDYTTLAECGIRHMDSIQVFEDASFPITLSLTGHDMIINCVVKCFETVGKLKEKIRELTGVLDEKQHLTYKDWYLDEEERQLVYFGIAKPVKYKSSVFKSPQRAPFWNRPNENFLIHVAFSDVTESSSHFVQGRYISTKADTFLEEFCNDHSSSNKLQIIVEIPNKQWRFPLMFQPTDTIGTMRDGIINRCRWSVGRFDLNYIKEGMFVLVFDTKLLEDESATLEKKGIRHKHSIRLFEKASFDIKIHAPECHVHTCVEARCYDTVDVLKEKLQVVTGIPKEKQHLRYRALNLDWFLDNNNGFLGDYDIAKQVRYNGGNFPFRPRILVASTKGLLKDICSF